MQSTNIIHIFVPYKGCGNNTLGVSSKPFNNNIELWTLIM